MLHSQGSLVFYFGSLMCFEVIHCHSHPRYLKLSLRVCCVGTSCNHFGWELVKSVFPAIYIHTQMRCNELYQYANTHTYHASLNQWTSRMLSPGSSKFVEIESLSHRTNQLWSCGDFTTSLLGITRWCCECQGTPQTGHYTCVARIVFLVGVAFYRTLANYFVGHLWFIAVCW